MHKLIFLALPLFIFFGTATLNAQDASKKEHQNKEHHATKDTTVKKDDCCSADKKDDCCSEDKKTNKDGHGKDEKASVKTVWNLYCPVTGEKIEEGAPTLEIEGKTVAVCCPGCLTKLKKEPAKYLKNLSEDGQTWLKK